MVVVTGREPDSRRPDGAMSSSDAEDDFLEPATPTATQAGHALSLLPQEFPEVVPLNIGGAHFTTRLSTLRRYEDTMLAAMFSGRHYIPTDAEGRYFIDRDGTHFGDVLNFLRSGDLPPRERVRAVYKEAQFYAIGPLLEQLENMQPLKGEKVRQAFLGLMPYYKDHLERIVEIARLRAVQRKARFAKLKVCVFKEEMPITPYECPLLNSLRFERSESDGQLFEHHCEVDVSFGPWEAVADVYDLLHCLVTDLRAQGLVVDHQCIGVCDKHLINHYYCKRPIYEFKITWWRPHSLRVGNSLLIQCLLSRLLFHARGRTAPKGQSPSRYCESDPKSKDGGKDSNAGFSAGSRTLQDGAPGRRPPDALRLAWYSEDVTYARPGLAPTQRRSQGNSQEHPPTSSPGPRK
ncbi:BTB/POZ domain-containing protein KCTD7 [Myotis brandtii]|uniref:BTB/POZ domain-containing protein KCTD7 n=3 Tax=Myotis brandtii TaxID=109478 RepID=S7N2Z7_MYOBR|nr:BTB/POZ domain-containing protein KCTD7 [Myotis brandtii]